MIAIIGCLLVDSAAIFFSIVRIIILIFTNLCLVLHLLNHVLLSNTIITFIIVVGNFLAVCKHFVWIYATFQGLSRFIFGPVDFIFTYLVLNDSNISTHFRLSLSHLIHRRLIIAKYLSNLLINDSLIHDKIISHGSILNLLFYSVSFLPWLGFGRILLSHYVVYHFYS